MKDKEKCFICNKDITNELPKIDIKGNHYCKDCYSDKCKKELMEKQIEEMSKEIYNTCAWRFGKPDDYKEVFNDIAEDLIKLNYRKLSEDSILLSKTDFDLILPPDSVVLTKKELDELYNDKLRSMYKDAYDTAFDSLRADLEKGKAVVLSEDSVVLSRKEYEELLKVNKADLAEQANYTRKETAEKISRELKAKFRKQEERFATDVTRFETDLGKVNESDLPTAKFLIGKATGQATMAEKAQYYIDELAKQFGVEIKE